MAAGLVPTGKFSPAAISGDERNKQVRMVINLTGLSNTVFFKINIIEIIEV